MLQGRIPISKIGAALGLFCSYCSSTNLEHNLDNRLASSAVTVSGIEFNLIQAAIPGCTQSAVRLNKDDIRIVPHLGLYYVIFNAFEGLTGDFMCEFKDLICQPKIAANDPEFNDLDGQFIDFFASREQALEDFSRANWLAIDEFRCGDSTIARSLGMKIAPVFDGFKPTGMIRVEFAGRDYILKI